MGIFRSRRALPECSGGGAPFGIELAFRFGVVGIGGLFIRNLARRAGVAHHDDIATLPQCFHQRVAGQSLRMGACGQGQQP